MTLLLSAFVDEAGDSTNEQLIACVKGGLTYIDPRSVDGYNITELPLDAAKKVAKRYHELGIRANMYGSPIGKIDITDDFQIDLDRLDHLGQLKGIFGATGVRIFSYYNKSGIDKSAWQRESINRLKRLRDRASQLGLVLFHENESEIFGEHPEDVMKIAELRDGQVFKLIYDFANYLRTGVQPQDCWAMFKGRTDCFHLKDQKVNGQHVPIGLGDTDAEAILCDAISSGWQGAFVLEPHLTHSQAVITTGVHGAPDVSLTGLSRGDTFQIAVNAARKIMESVGALQS